MSTSKNCDSRRSLFHSLPCLIAAISTMLICGCKDANTGKASETTWHPYASIDGIMKASFPAKPSIREKSQESAIGTMNFKMAVAQASKKLAYTASSVTLPVDPAKYNVQAGLDGAVKQAKGTILNDLELEKDGNAGREILVKDPSGMFIRARTFIVASGPTIVQINIAAAKRTDVEGEIADKFLDSVEFVKTSE